MTPPNERDIREQERFDLTQVPIGTKAPAIGGGHWVKVAGGWKWHNGDTFPQPGGDWTGELIPPAAPVERGEPDKMREALVRAIKALAATTKGVEARLDLETAAGRLNGIAAEELADALLALRAAPSGEGWVSAAEADFLFAALEQVAQTLSHEAEIAKNAIKEHGARTWPRIHTTSAGETQ